MVAISNPTKNRIIAVGALIVAAVVADRLTHIPTAAPLADDRLWTVPVGYEVTLTGPEQPELLTVQTGSGDGITVTAGPVRMADGRVVKELGWVVPGPADPADDYKVGLQIDAQTPSATATVRLKRIGAKTDPQLQLQADGTALSVSGNVIFGDRRVMPATRLVADNVPVDQPFPAVDFTLMPGGTMAFTLAHYEDGTRHGLTTTVGADNGQGPRLWLKRISYQAESATDAKKAACAAPPKSILWSTMFRASGVPRGSDCHANQMLAMSDIKIDKDSVGIALLGSAFTYDSDKPVLARWFQWAKDNPVIGVVIGLVLAALGGWIKRVFTPA